MHVSGRVDDVHGLVAPSDTRVPALMATAAMVSIASVRRCSVGAASMRVVPTRE